MALGVLRLFLNLEGMLDLSEFWRVILSVTDRGYLYKIICTLYLLCVL